MLISNYLPTYIYDQGNLGGGYMAMGFGLGAVVLVVAIVAVIGFLLAALSSKK